MRRNSTITQQIMVARVRSFRAGFKLFFDCFFQLVWLSESWGCGFFIAVINFLITDKQKHRASRRRRINVCVIKMSILLECLDG